MGGEKNFEGGQCESEGKNMGASGEGGSMGIDKAPVSDLLAYQELNFCESNLCNNNKFATINFALGNPKVVIDWTIVCYDRGVIEGLGGDDECYK
ncbi:unnamed protein product, partial [Ilex paraguariensis]